MMYAPCDIYRDLVAHRALEQHIAYDAARTEIETNCLEVSRGGEFRWYDTAVPDPDDREYLALRVRYLKGRELLEEWPGSPHIVRVLDEPTARGWESVAEDFD